MYSWATIWIKFITLNDILSQWVGSHFCPSSVLILPSQPKKVHFRRLYLQSLNQKYKKHAAFFSQINVLEVHWTHCWERLEADDLFNS